ncbi:hypothetical protein FXV77_12200 [Sphingobacterium phlebotomi]|uniref:Uncharacterized protein n=1 Tax=Sphingobacterium phlebotomi TaxID=2605433 RepID=A0A5D4HAK1_9SPHI|nr:hypothetical protein [Sphingobacterium phlebotomi]TYR35830.1 hypothetical protein FXV77_12200 [Sphingobacterium phlebotomi]
MENKERYHSALVENDSQLNEIDLGEKMGLSEEETTRIIAQLLSEYKIEYVENRACNYRSAKKLTR